MFASRSIHATSISVRAWSSGWASAFQADEGGSIPPARSNTKGEASGDMASKSAARRAWRVARGKFDPRCDYCGIVTSEHVAETHPQRATVEDIVPLSKGGNNNRSNWALACSACNQAKGDLHLDPKFPKLGGRFVNGKGAKRGRYSRRAPVSQKLIDRIIADDHARRDRAAALGFTLYTPIPGVPDDGFR